MNRSRLYQILYILLMPYREAAFIENNRDYLKNVRRSYFQARESVQDNALVRDRLERTYMSYMRELEDFLRQHGKLRIHSMDDTIQLINLFYPEKEIADLLECYECEKREDAINVWYLDNIFRIAESLLTFRDGKIAIRTWVNKEKTDGSRDIFDHYDAFNKAEIWNILSRMVVPDVFIAAFYVECGWTDKKYVYNQLGNVSLADKELDVILRKGLAETHMHFNAGVHYLTLWEEFTDPLKWYGKIIAKNIDIKRERPDEKWVLHMIIYRMLMAEFLQYKNTTHYFCGFLEEEYGEQAKTICCILQEFKRGKEVNEGRIITVFKDLVSDWKNKYSIRESGRDFLYETVYKRDIVYSVSAEILFEIQVLEWLKGNRQDVQGCHLFIQYLRVKNIYFERIIQSDNVLGVRNFQKYYSRATMLGQDNSQAYARRIRAIFENQIQNTNLRKMEIRITPPLFLDVEHFYVSEYKLRSEMKRKILSDIKDIMDAYLSCIRDFMNRNSLGNSFEQLDQLCEQGAVGIPAIGIVFHFIKSESLDNRLGNMCWLREAEGSYIYNKHILTYRKKMIQSAKAIEELRGEIPLLSEYVVGIDAASEEFLAEPWVMAPVYSAIRNRNITKPVINIGEGEPKRIQNLGFTYHVGEEFRHLLSGFRYVDEVIERFGYKTGDRIGHAIVLGEDIDWWIENNEVVTIPINEYMEDLLWLWGNVVHEKMRVSVSVKIIEEKILELAQRIYGDISGLTVSMLYQAYNEKFKGYHEKTFEKMKKCVKEEPVNDTGHFCKYYDEKSSSGIFWTKEKILCTYFCPICWQQFQNPILVAVKKEDANLFKEIQQQLVRKIEKLGIYVETNPTSNSVLGEMSGVLCHHILNLNSRGLKIENSNSVLVTINSDDPVVFNTNNENEISYIYYALLHSGYNKESILEWIDKVRRYGLDSSFIKEEKKPSRQIKEIEKLLKKIDEYMIHPPIVE